jgi:hypothetical protein
MSKRVSLIRSLAYVNLLEDESPYSWKFVKGKGPRTGVAGLSLRSKHYCLPRNLLLIHANGSGDLRTLQHHWVFAADQQTVLCHFLP